MFNKIVLFICHAPERVKKDVTESKSYHQNDNVFLRRFNANKILSSEETGLLSRLCASPKSILRGQDLLSDPNRTVIILDGYGSSYRTLANGKQVIFDFRLPGDMACLRNIVFGRTRQNLMATTDMVVCIVPTRTVRSLMENSRHLKDAFVDGLDAEDENLTDRFAQIARYTAIGRTASLMLDLLNRMTRVGLVRNMSFPFNITQDDLADALGVTPVHINRTLRQLREDGIVTIARGMATVHDVASLRSLAC